METAIVNGRLAQLISRLHGWIPKDKSYDLIVSLRDGDPHDTFTRLCEAVTLDGVILNARCAREVEAIGKLLHADRSLWSAMDFYAAA